MSKSIGTETPEQLQAQFSDKSELQFGHKSVSGALHKQVKRLLSLALIERSLPDKPSSKIQNVTVVPAGARA